MYLLGCIDQQKKESECARRDFRQREWQCCNFIEKVLDFFCTAITATARLARAPEVVHDLKCLFSFESANDAAECAGETPYILVQGDVLGTG